MDKKELKEVKQNFLIQLYDYRCHEEQIVAAIKNLKEDIETLQKIRVFSDINIKDVTNMLSNKFTMTVSFFKKKDIDFIFFEDYDAGSLYPSNFFSGIILRHFICEMLEIEKVLAKFSRIVRTIIFKEMELSTRIPCKMKFLLKSIPLHDGNEVVLGLIDDGYECYRELTSLLDAYYREDISDNYIKIVDNKIKSQLSQSRSFMGFTYNIPLFYQIDVDFLRVTNREDLIPELRETYLKQLEEHNFYKGLIDSDITYKFFTKRKTSELDLDPYLYVSASELALAVFTDYISDMESPDTVGPEISPSDDFARATAVLNYNLDELKNILSGNKKRK